MSRWMMDKFSSPPPTKEYRDNYDATFGKKAQDKDQAIFDSLTGKFRHWCPDWDGMPIDETMDEFDCCTCGCEL